MILGGGDQILDDASAVSNVAGVPNGCGGMAREVGDDLPTPRCDGLVGHGKGSFLGRGCHQGSGRTALLQVDIDLVGRLRDVL